MFNEKNDLLDELKHLKKKIKIKLNVEDRLFVLEQIRKATEKRIEYMETEKRKMLNSILKKENKKITIDRLIINRNNESNLILDRREILEETKKHFKSITDTIQSYLSIANFYITNFLDNYIKFTLVITN